MSIQFQFMFHCIVWFFVLSDDVESRITESQVDNYLVRNQLSHLAQQLHWTTEHLMKSLPKCDIVDMELLQLLTSALRFHCSSDDLVNTNMKTVSDDESLENLATAKRSDIKMSERGMRQSVRNTILGKRQLYSTSDESNNVLNEREHFVTRRGGRSLLSGLLEYLFNLKTEQEATGTLQGTLD